MTNNSTRKSNKSGNGKLLTTPAAKIEGKWRITGMEQWDMDYVDMEAPGMIVFKKKGAGEMSFGCVRVGLDWRLDPDVGRAEFTFSGFDEGTEISGRGWAKVSGDKLEGKIFIHQGDDSGFKAAKFL